MVPCAIYLANRCITRYYVSILFADIVLIDVSRDARELVNYHAQRIIRSTGFRTRINLLSREFLAGQAEIPSPLDSSYVPPREIIYRRRYGGIESRCTLIRFFQCN